MNNEYIENIMNENPEFKDCKLYYSEFYKNCVSYVSIKGNKKLYVRYPVEYRDNIPHNIELKYINADDFDIYDFYVSNISQEQLKMYKDEYKKEMKELEDKYDFLKDIK